VVRISTATAAGGRTVQMSVTDNGPGMTEEVRRRCLEPFFTTKTRGISTGLGLTLVCGSLRAVGGQVEIESSPGQGTTFRMSIPVWNPVAGTGAPGGASAVPEKPGSACVEIGDERMRAFVAAVLRTLGVEVLAGANWADRGAGAPTIAVLNGSAAGAEVAEFLRGSPTRRAVVFADPPGPNAAVPDRAAYLGEKPAAAGVRAALVEAVRGAGAGKQARGAAREEVRA